MLGERHGGVLGDAIGAEPIEARRPAALAVLSR